MTAIDAAAALRRAAGVGPYFALDQSPSGDGWLPLRSLLDDPATVHERVDFVRGAVALRCEVEPASLDARACASIHFLGLASRLVAPALAAASLDAVVVSFLPDDVFWQRVDGGPVPLAARAVSGSPAADPAQAAALLHDGALSVLAAPLVDAFAEVMRLSRTVLWGNVASALTGAAAMLLRSGERTILDPVEIVAAALDAGPLAGSGRFDVPDRFFVRNSCCLFYRIPNAGKCGDCVLLPRVG